MNISTDVLVSILAPMLDSRGIAALVCVSKAHAACTLAYRPLHERICRGGTYKLTATKMEEVAPMLFHWCSLLTGPRPYTRPVITGSIVWQAQQLLACIPLAVVHNELNLHTSK